MLDEEKGKQRKKDPGDFQRQHAGGVSERPYQGGSKAPRTSRQAPSAGRVACRNCAAAGLRDCAPGIGASGGFGTPAEGFDAGAQRWTGYPLLRWTSGVCTCSLRICGGSSPWPGWMRRPWRRSLRVRWTRPFGGLLLELLRRHARADSQNPPQAIRLHAQSLAALHRHLSPCQLPCLPTPRAQLPRAIIRSKVGNKGLRLHPPQAEETEVVT